MGKRGLGIEIDLRELLGTVSTGVAESELHADNKCAQQALALISTTGDFHIKLKAAIFATSSSVMGVSHRQGLEGRTRHVKLQYLWLLASEDFHVAKVHTNANVAGAMTMYRNAEH